MSNEAAFISQPPEGLTAELLLALLKRARWAPSGDNCQPWVVRTSADGEALEVCFNPTIEEAFLDVNFEASRMALGAFVENLRLAAASEQRACDVALTNDNETVWARLKFRTDVLAQPESLSQYIEQRLSNRRMYERGSCTEDELQAISAILDGVEGTGVHFVTAPEELAMVADAVAITDKIRMQQRNCHEEFHEKIRWSARQAKENPTGFYVKTFEIKPHEAFALRLTRSFALMSALDPLTRMSAMAAALARRQVLASGAIGMLASSGRSGIDMMRAGIALQRIWLKATKLGLAFQVMAVAPLFIRRVRLGGEGFSEPQRTRIERAREILASVPAAPAPEDVAVMFRIGRAAAPSARTGRLEPERFLVASLTPDS